MYTEWKEKRRRRGWRKYESYTLNSVLMYALPWGWLQLVISEETDWKRRERSLKPRSTVDYRPLSVWEGNKKSFNLWATLWRTSKVLLYIVSGCSPIQIIWYGSKHSIEKIVNETRNQSEGDFEGSVDSVKKSKGKQIRHGWLCTICNSSLQT